ncbi:MAG TPA: ATP-binding protein [Bacteroidetes bacterium]|nr:ATP-binding protein [Bacteroidota bacterium]HEX04816.1 ATP-binding protein [Bacteroidota bacterium]
MDADVYELDLSRMAYLRPFAANVILAAAYELQDNGASVVCRYPVRPNALHQFHYLRLDGFFEKKIELKRETVSALPIFPFRDTEMRKKYLPNIPEQILSLIAGAMPLENDLRKLVYLSLKECTDNVDVHTKGNDLAVVSANVIRTRKRIRICILDRGLGIPASLRRNPKYRGIKSELELLKLSTDYQVTGTEDLRGWGLWLLKQLVRDNGGTLSLLSGNYVVQYHPDESVSTKRLKTHFKGTIVNIELKINKKFVFLMDDYMDEAEAIF